MSLIHYSYVHAIATEYMRHDNIDWLATVIMATYTALSAQCAGKIVLLYCVIASILINYKLHTYLPTCLLVYGFSTLVCIGTTG